MDVCKAALVQRLSESDGRLARWASQPGGIECVERVIIDADETVIVLALRVWCWGGAIMGESLLEKEQSWAAGVGVGAAGKCPQTCYPGAASLHWFAPSILCW